MTTITNDTLTGYIVPIDRTLDVLERLAYLARWQGEYECERACLQGRARTLGTHYIDQQKATQIAQLGHRIRMMRVRKPLVILPRAQATEEEAKAEMMATRANLARQFAGLSKEQRLLWLNNFVFVMTPDLLALLTRIGSVRGYEAIGQQRNFLISGPSGIGKTSFLDWYMSHNPPIVHEEWTEVPVIKVDASQSKQTIRPLLRRMVLEYGISYLKGDGEEELRDKLIGYAERCGTTLAIIDEVENIDHETIKKRFVDLSNGLRRIPIICASVNPRTFTDGSPALAGRWKDSFDLQPYEGARLAHLLSFLSLLLPFPTASCLTHKEVVARVGGWTGGTLKQIMYLVHDAATRAVETDQPCLSAEMLERAWTRMQAGSGSRAA
jgi:hypothetical protein